MAQSNKDDPMQSINGLANELGSDESSTRCQAERDAAQSQLAKTTQMNLVEELWEDPHCCPAGM